MSDADSVEGEVVPFNLYRLEAESKDSALARAALDPSTNAAIALDKWAERLGQQNINEVRAELERQAKAASANDLARLESMLTMQAHTLDALFSNLAIRARNTLQYPQAWERFMRMALKAQSQCRTTIETLAEIKNPKPVAFVKQANIAAGPQQVNNGVSAPSRAGNSNQPNEVLEAITDGDRLEHGAAGTAGVGNPALAPLGKGDRAKVPRR
jgi:hypothetical protein